MELVELDGGGISSQKERGKIHGAGHNRPQGTSMEEVRKSWAVLEASSSVYCSVVLYCLSENQTLMCLGELESGIGSSKNNDKWCGKIMEAILQQPSLTTVFLTDLTLLIPWIDKNNTKGTTSWCWSLNACLVRMSCRILKCLFSLQ